MIADLPGRLHEAEGQIPLDPDEMVVRLKVAVRDAADWIAARVGSDGRPIGSERVNHWYRLPWAMALAGRPDVASSVLSWADREALTPEGDLRAGAAQTNWNRTGWTTEAASYPLAILAVGAWHLERYDIASRIMSSLLAYQSPTTGGGYIERPESRRTDVQDLMCTAQLGLAALTTGRMAVAEAAFGWLQRMYELQPSLPHRLYLRTDDDGLITDVPPGSEFRYVMRSDRPRQAFYMPGIAAAFAIRYAQATGDSAGLRIGRGLLDFSRQADESQYDFHDTVHVGKLGWGAGVMVTADGQNPDALDTALRMGQWYLDSQLDDGRWNPTTFLVPKPDDADALWKTSEHIVLITMVQEGLASRSRTGSERSSDADNH